MYKRQPVRPTPPGEAAIAAAPTGVLREAMSQLGLSTAVKPTLVKARRSVAKAVKERAMPDEAVMELMRASGYRN